MTAPIINRSRANLLGATDRGHVYRSYGGCDLRQVRRGQNQRVDRRLRELREAGWVELGPDGRTYQLTDAGRGALLEAGERP